MNELPPVMSARMAADITGREPIKVVRFTDSDGRKWARLADGEWERIQHYARLKELADRAAES